jgi:hypothetical protein
MAVALASADRPRVGSTRTNLERLLRACDALGAGGLASRAERRRFETYLSTLQRLWHELANAPAGACAEGQLGEYRRRIERLAELLDADKLLSGAGSALALTQAVCNGHISREQANAELSSRLHATSRMQRALRDQLFGPVNPSPLALAGGAEQLPPPSPGACCTACAGSAASGGIASAVGRGGAFDAAVPASAATRESLFGRSGGARRGSAADGAAAESLAQTLAGEREQQDAALSDLTKMASELKNRSLRAQQAMHAQNSTLDTTSTALDSNRSKARRTRPQPTPTRCPSQPTPTDRATADGARSTPPHSSKPTSASCGSSCVRCSRRRATSCSCCSSSPSSSSSPSCS